MKENEKYAPPPPAIRMPSLSPDYRLHRSAELTFLPVELSQHGDIVQFRVQIRVEAKRPHVSLGSETVITHVIKVIKQRHSMGWGSGIL